MSTARPLDRRPGVTGPGRPATTRVVIIGGGIIGLACAWRLLRAGCAVTVLDPTPGRGATHAAGGMITPASEATFGQEVLLAASIASAESWPAFATDLEGDFGKGIDLVRRSTLFVAADKDDEVGLARHARLLERHRRPVERLPSRAARRLEPALSPRLAGSLLIEGESSVDPRQVTQALLATVTDLGGTVRTSRARPLSRGGRCVGAELTSGEVVEADVTVLAAGWETTDLAAGLGVRAPIRPLKGQVLRLRSTAPDTLGRVIRASVHGRFVYLVPRPGREVVVGATSEDVGVDLTVTAGGVHDLLHDAIAVVPELAEAALVESLARLRPATPDNLPLVGPVEPPGARGDSAGADGLLIAAGHGRDGVLLAPLTADIITAHVCGSTLPHHADSLAAQRYQLEEAR